MTLHTRGHHIFKEITCLCLIYFFPLIFISVCVCVYTHSKLQTRQLLLFCVIHKETDKYFHIPLGK